MASLADALMPVLPANKGQRGRSLRNVGGSHVVGRGNMPVVWKHNEAWKTGGKRRKSEGDTNREKHKRKRKMRLGCVNRITSGLAVPFVAI